MSEWWTYTLADFLLFSPRTYYRLLELYNLAIWPAQLAGVAIGLAIAVLLAVDRPSRARIVAGLLGACWLWIAWAYHHERYAQINWAAPWFAAAFAIEGLLLAALGAAAGRLEFRPASRSRRRIAAGFVTIVVLAYPLFAPLAGRVWTTAEAFGAAPDPTAIVTAVAVALADTRLRWWLLVVPLLWCAVAAATLGAMHAPEAAAVAAAAVAALALAAHGRHDASILAARRMR